MIVVSDTGPMHYLILIDHIEILPQLFSGAILPPAVVHELTAEQTPALVAAWALDLPSWVKVVTPTAVKPFGQLGRGELEAIALASEFQIPLLCDDGPARAAAAESGIEVSGTLGVLQVAHARGLLDVEEALNLLSSTNFRYSPALFEQVIHQAHRLRSLWT